MAEVPTGDPFAVVFVLRALGRLGVLLLLLLTLLSVLRIRLGLMPPLILLVVLWLTRMLSPLVTVRTMVVSPASLLLASRSIRRAKLVWVLVCRLLCCRPTSMNSDRKTVLADVIELTTFSFLLKGMGRGTRLASISSRLLQKMTRRMTKATEFVTWATVLVIPLSSGVPVLLRWCWVITWVTPSASRLPTLLLVGMGLLWLTIVPLTSFRIRNC